MADEHETQQPPKRKMKVSTSISSIDPAMPLAANNLGPKRAQVNWTHVPRIFGRPGTNNCAGSINSAGAGKRPGAGDGCDVNGNADLLFRRQSLLAGHVSGTPFTAPTYCRLLNFDAEQWGLPQALSPEDRSNRIEVGENNLVAKYAGPGRNDSDAAAIRANHPVPPQIGCYYYEMTVASAGRDGYIAAGFAIKSASLSRLTGWEPGTVGYHADDGNLYRGAGTGASFGPSYGTGDVVGCGIDFVRRSFFFTKNGLFIGDVTNLKDKFHLPLFPCVGCRTHGEVVVVNFNGPFVFDIEGWIERRMRGPFTTGKEASAVDRLVLSHLVHGGWEKTAQAFTKSLANPADMHGVCGIENAFKVAKERRFILQLIAEGSISAAIAHLHAHYAQFLERPANEDLRLQLDCLRFIELMAQREASLGALTPQDDELELKRIMEHGRHLLENYSKETRALQQVLMDDCFALLAYQRPSASPLSYLLTAELRNHVAMSLDEALLRHEGQPIKSPLHRLIQHTQVLLGELQRLEDPEVALIDI